MHGQQDVRGISHWFCDAKTCCWLYTGFFGAKIVKSASGRGQFTIFITIVFLTLRQHGEEEQNRRREEEQEKEQCSRRIKEGQQTSSEKPAVKEGQQ